MRSTRGTLDQAGLIVPPAQPEQPVIALDASSDAARTAPTPLSVTDVPTATNQVERLVRTAIGATALLSVATALLYFFRGAGDVLPALPWFNPFVLTFQALTCLVTSVLVLGRYRVLRDRPSFWIGSAFSAYAIVLVFYVLAWPGLLPDGTSFLADQPGTAAWFPAWSAIVLTGCLLTASAVRGPTRLEMPQRPWVGWLAALLGGTTLVCLLLIGFEHYLPALVLADGTFTPLLNASNAALVVLFSVGAALSIRASRRTGDPLLALVALFQVAAAFVYLWVFIGTVRYDLWWYLGRAVLTAGALVVLFGLLADYVNLLRREREKSRTLAARSREMLGIESRLRDNFLRLQQAHAELQDTDRRKTEFISMLSHELRNPLATISNALFVMQAHAATDPVLARVRDAAVRQSAHMARLLDDLLDVSRINRGRITLDKTSMDLVGVARDAVDAVQPSIEAKGQALTVSLPPELAVEGDAVRLTQAISNLLHNAAKYTPEQGRIELSVEVEGRQAVVRVRDDGVGIAPDVLPDIFDLFVQADQALDRSHGGLGVGLTVARSLIELHGGSIEVHSEGLGQGSEFVLRLPLELDITSS